MDKNLIFFFYTCHDISSEKKVNSTENSIIGEIQNFYQSKWDASKKLLDLSDSILRDV